MDNLHGPLSVPELAATVGVSTPHMQALFRTDVGVPLGEYIRRARIERACDLLVNSTLAVSEISRRVGFSTSQHFATTFRQFTRETPTHYRRDHAERSDTPV